MIELCRLLKEEIVPKEEFRRVLRESETAGVEIGMEFVCFEDDYYFVKDHITDDDIVIDLGCGYDPQCFLFTNNERYIAVDYGIEDGVHFDDGHVEFYNQTIQDFLTKTLPALNLPMSRVVAICNAVPDNEARDMAEQMFDRFYIAYPKMETRYCFDGKNVITEKTEFEMEV